MPCRPKAPPPIRCSSRACSTSPTISGPTASSIPRTSCATTMTIRISWSRPTRAPRRSPIPRTASRSIIDFWLGDAFASGGSAGYDHKKMGITARGAWEAVKRHFREMDVDIGDDAVHGRGRRRHVGRRVRQRHAARAHHQAGRGVRSSRHLHRSQSRSGAQLHRAPAPVRSLALELAGLQQGLSLGRRRHLFAQGEGDRAERRGGEAARPRRREVHAAAGDDRDPEAQRRPAVVRRHRHLCARRERDRRRRSATASTIRSASPARRCAARWWARAPISA